MNERENGRKRSIPLSGEEALALAEVRKIQSEVTENRFREVEQKFSLGVFMTEKQAAELGLKGEKGDVAGEVFVAKEEFKKKLRREGLMEHARRCPELAEWLRIPRNETNRMKYAFALSGGVAYQLLFGLGGEDGRKVAALGRALVQFVQLVKLAYDGLAESRSGKSEAVLKIEDVINRNAEKAGRIKDIQKNFKNDASRIAGKVFENWPNTEVAVITENNHKAIDQLLSFLKKDDNYKYLDGETGGKLRRLMLGAEVDESVLRKWDGQLKQIEDLEAEREKKEKNPTIADLRRTLADRMETRAAEPGPAPTFAFNNLGFN